MKKPLLIAIRAVSILAGCQTTGAGKLYSKDSISSKPYRTNYSSDLKYAIDLAIYSYPRRCVFWTMEDQQHPLLRVCGSARCNGWVFACATWSAVSDSAATHRLCRLREKSVSTTRCTKSSTPGANAEKTRRRRRRRRRRAVTAVMVVVMALAAMVNVYN